MVNFIRDHIYSIQFKFPILLLRIFTWDPGLVLGPKPTKSLLSQGKGKEAGGLPAYFCLLLQKCWETGSGIGGGHFINSAYHRVQVEFYKTYMKKKHKPSLKDIKENHIRYHPPQFCQLNFIHQIPNRIVH